MYERRYIYKHTCIYTYHAYIDTTYIQIFILLRFQDLLNLNLPRWYCAEMYKCTYINIFTYICLYICIYVHIHIHPHTYIHMYSRDIVPRRAALRVKPIFICAHVVFIRVTWLIHICDMTHSYVWHDSFICVTWLIHVCDVTHSYHMCAWSHAQMLLCWKLWPCTCSPIQIRSYLRKGLPPITSFLAASFPPSLPRSLSRSLAPFLARSFASSLPPIPPSFLPPSLPASLPPSLPLSLSPSLPRSLGRMCRHSRICSLLPILPALLHTPWSQKRAEWWLFWFLPFLKQKLCKIGLFWWNPGLFWLNILKNRAVLMEYRALLMEYRALLRDYIGLVSILCCPFYQELSTWSE